MNRVRIGLVGIMLFLPNNLSGCESTELTGPDFSETFTKVIHLEPGIQITYELPGNMSSFMNFGDRYKNASRTCNKRYSASR